MADLGYLRSMPHVQPWITNLYGSILPVKELRNDDARRYVKGIRITATREGSETSTVTDAEGYFQFLDLSPGSYDVVADLPSYIKANGLRKSSWKEAAVPERSLACGGTDKSEAGLPIGKVIQFRMDRYL